MSSHESTPKTEVSSTVGERFDRETLSITANTSRISIQSILEDTTTSELGRKRLPDDEAIVGGSVDTKKVKREENIPRPTCKLPCGNGSAKEDDHGRMAELRKELYEKSYHLITKANNIMDEKLLKFAVMEKRMAEMEGIQAKVEKLELALSKLQDDVSSIHAQL